MRQRIMLVLVIAIIILSCSGVAWAARLHGDVYDLSLDRLSNVVIEVNTTPQQRVISQNGSYSFTLPVGSYRLRALQYQGSIVRAKAEENVSVVDNGDYVIDLFLYPNLDEPDPINNTGNESQLPTLAEDLALLIVLAMILIGGIALTMYLIRNRRQISKKTTESAAQKAESKPEVKPEVKEQPEPAAKETTAGAKQNVDEDLGKVIEILKAEGGRATQKEIRKHIPLSEAKVSLIITEMEAKGLIEKIKKGRGNIIILKKSG